MNIYFGDDKRPRHWTYNNDPEPPLSPPEPKGYECEWCGATVETDDYIIGEKVLCENCYKKAHSFESAAEYVAELLQDGMIGSVKAFFAECRVGSEDEFADSVIEHFGEEYLRYANF